MTRGTADREYMLAEEAQMHIRNAKAEVHKATLFAPDGLGEKLTAVVMALLDAEAQLHRWLGER